MVFWTKSDKFLGACRTCEFLLHKGAKIPDKPAPLGVCKVEFCDKSQNSLLEGLKPDKLLGNIRALMTSAYSLNDGVKAFRDLENNKDGRMFKVFLES